MPTDLQVVTVKLPKGELRRFPPGTSRSAFIREAIAEKLNRQGLPAWQPKTARGKKLLALSDRFEGERLGAAEINEELRARRGGIN